MRIFAIAFIFKFVLAVTADSAPRCRCTPDQSCWPSDEQWQALNNSVSGRLTSVQPVAWVCHDPTFNNATCQNLTAINTNSLWRREQPGAVQMINWESWLLVNQSCYFETPRSVPCGQGKISKYSVVAESVEDIQSAVCFAAAHNLRLVIKNSGHDYLGRSTAPESLQIATFKLNNIEFSDDFVPQGSTDGKSVGSTVTIGAGAVLFEIYAALLAKGKVAVLGSAYTVGAAGGYVQGGGHSPIGSWKGMGSDNAIEFDVVTAEGDLITVNEYQNTDLFWALRGGGGGTFGVVTRVTLRTFDEAPMVVARLNISALASENTNYWPAVATFSSYVPRLEDENCSGYYYMFPNLTSPGLGQVSAVAAVILCAERSNTTEVEDLLKPMLDPIRKMAGITVSLQSTAYSKTVPAVTGLLSGGADTTGNILILASRLISRELLLSEDGPTRFTNALSQLPAGDTEFGGCFVAGGQVARNGDQVRSALNPAWRRTAVHLIWGHSWAPGASREDVQAIENQITHQEVPILSGLEPGMGAYLNEADANEADFQESFWGPNYARLRTIKQEWDPTGLFITRKGVGSEDWDDAGLCRLTG
ncbi:hypothetical protein V8E54_007928 [Elaphomyces granulatus]